MRRLILNLCIILAITIANSKYNSVSNYIRADVKSECSLTPMEALDLIKGCYAANFERIYEKTSDLNYYYYKLASADYYLVYEGETGKERDYLIHLYEFVIDNTDTGVGHTVTYGWYTVDRERGYITVKTY
jgi:hypothetical protein